MHVPDGIIPLWLLLIMWIISGTMLVIAFRKINQKLDEKLVPYMGVLAAVIFAAQLINFPVTPFASGHLVGSTLLAVMVGPFAGMIIIALVLFVQALYTDGGLLTYGLNFFNMGVIGCLLGYALSLLLFRALKRFLSERNALFVGVGIAAFSVTVIAAFTLGLELLTVPGFNLVFLTFLTGIHVVIGVAEAILTVLVLLYFYKAKPQIIALLSGRDEATGLPTSVEPAEEVQS